MDFANAVQQNYKKRKKGERKTFSEGQIFLRGLRGKHRIMLMWANPGLFYIYFCLFVHKILVASRIPTQIVIVVGKAADHLTATMAQTQGHCLIMKYFTIRSTQFVDLKHVRFNVAVGN